MIVPETLFKALIDQGIGLFAGVPDSLLRSFCAYVDDHGGPSKHVITANEGNAVALAAGYHLSTGKTGAVYLQNSGLGNTINPLTFLTDRDVYRIPLLLIIGWRGEPGVKDEPQHVKQGRITRAQLDLLEIPHWVLDGDSAVDQVLPEVFAALSDRNAPVALLVRKGTFSSYESRRPLDEAGSLTREEVLRRLLDLMDPRDVVVATTGKTSRELFELRAERGEAQRDFLTVGGMGHAASIALGVALGNLERRVICLDGDGSMLMHFGAVPIIGDLQPPNFIHVLLNNAAHESVGGQPTVAGGMDFSAIAKACGYREYRLAVDWSSLEDGWRSIEGVIGPVLIEVRIRVGSREDLGSPTSTTVS